MNAVPQVVRLLDQQIQPAAELMGRAFADYPLYQSFFPEADRRIQNITMLNAILIRYCQRYGEVFTTPNLQGVACWLPPGREHMSLLGLLRSGVLRLPWQLGWRTCWQLKRDGEYLEKVHTFCLGNPHWYLLLLAVDPTWQNQGVGTLLMEPILKKAQTMGFPCYLETQKESNVAIYRKRGFHVVACKPSRGGDYQIWGMVREEEFKNGAE